MSLRLRRSARAKTESKFNVGDVVEVSLRVDVGLSWLCWGAGGAAQTERQAGVQRATGARRNQRTKSKSKTTEGRAQSYLWDISRPFSASRGDLVSPMGRNLMTLSLADADVPEDLLRTVLSLAGVLVVPFLRGGATTVRTEPLTSR